MQDLALASGFELDIHIVLAVISGCDSTYTHQDYDLLRCYAMFFGRRVPVFWMNLFFL